MKKIIYLVLIASVVSFSSCDIQEDSEIATISNESTEIDSREDGICMITNRAACDNNLTYDGCSFTSGEAIYDGNLHNEFELLLNNCYTEPLPSNCEWSGNQTEYILYYHSLTGCCYDYNTYNFRLDQIQSVAMSGRPSSSYLIIGYEVNFIVLGTPKFQVKVTYRKKGICSVASDVDIAK